MTNPAQLILNIATVAGQFITDSFPLFYWIFGFALALLGLSIFYNAIVGSFKKFGR